MQVQALDGVQYGWVICVLYVVNFVSNIQYVFSYLGAYLTVFTYYGSNHRAV